MTIQHFTQILCTQIYLTYRLINVIEYKIDSYWMNRTPASPVFKQRANELQIITKVQLICKVAYSQRTCIVEFFFTINEWFFDFMYFQSSFYWFLSWGRVSINILLRPVIHAFSIHMVEYKSSITTLKTA